MKKLFGLFVFGLILFFGCSTQQGSPSATLDMRYKDQIIAIAGRAYERELTSGTGGDISVRVPDSDHFIIKGTGNCFGDLSYDRLSTVGLDGKVLPGSPQPSHETDIHCAIYNLREEVGAVMHVHSPYATAWATCGRTIPPITQQSVEVLKDVQIIPYYPPGSMEMLDAVMDCYNNPVTKVVMMENHGVFLVGNDLPDLLYKAEVIENTARIAILCENIGAPVKFEYMPPIPYHK
ncbi:MAG: class II aldolase/adducin family protein [Fidelibacterota bacterium]|nr:MAG: class II aldolase/adducin family protein [Candidatus Neomarinimicrobiota bacterium]